MLSLAREISDRLSVTGDMAAPFEPPAGPER
jgi:hypothetical protein